MSAVVPPGYKQTEVGVIPEDWEYTTFVKAKSSYIDYRGRTPKKLGMDWGGGDILALSANNVQMGRINTEREAYFGSDKLYRKWMLQGECQPGDVLLTMEAPLGNVAQIPDERRYILSQRVLLIKSPRWLDKNYFAHFMQGGYFQNQLSLNSTGSTAQGIQRKKLDEILVYFPPTKLEQQRIAEALSGADALIEGLRQLITKKLELKQGAMQELLGSLDGETSKPLSEVSTMKGRIGWQGLKQTEFTTNREEPFLITGMNFKDGAIRWDEVYHVSEERYQVAKEIQLRRNDVLMTKDGTIGKMLFVDSIPYPGRATLNSHLLLFRPKENVYHPKFLYYQMLSKQFLDFIELHKSGSTFFGISQAAVGKYSVLMPPLPEQTRIATVLSDMDAEIAGLEVKLDKARRVKEGMMQDLLTGKVRLA